MILDERLCLIKRHDITQATLPLNDGDRIAVSGQAASVDAIAERKSSTTGSTAHRVELIPKQKKRSVFMTQQSFVG